MKKLLIILVLSLCAQIANAQCINNFAYDTVSTYSGAYINVSWSDTQSATSYYQLYVGGCNMASLPLGQTHYSIATNSYPCYVGNPFNVPNPTATVVVVRWQGSVSCSSQTYTVPIPSNYLYYSCQVPYLKNPPIYSGGTLAIGWYADFAPSHTVTYTLDGGSPTTATAGATSFEFPVNQGVVVNYYVTSVCSATSKLSTPMQTYTTPITTPTTTTPTTSPKKGKK